MAQTILAQFPDVRASIAVISNIGAGGRNSDLQFNLVGPDLQKHGLRRADHHNLRTTSGLVDVDMTLANRKPELRVEIDRERGESVRFADSGYRGHIADTGRRRSSVRSVGATIFMTCGSRRRARPHHAGSAGGCHAPAEQWRQRHEHFVGADGELLHFREARGPNQIDRFQRQRKVTIVANLTADTALGDAISEVQGRQETGFARCMSFSPAAQTLQTFQNFTRVRSR
jgi:multidrug efflux pump subunit AcrB